MTIFNKAIKHKPFVTFWAKSYINEIIVYTVLYEAQFKVGLDKVKQSEEKAACALLFLWPDREWYTGRKKKGIPHDRNRASVDHLESTFPDDLSLYPLLCNRVKQTCDQSGHVCCMRTDLFSRKSL